MLPRNTTTGFCPTSESLLLEQAHYNDLQLQQDNLY